MKNEQYVHVRYLPFGDSALLVEFGDAISSDLNRKVITLNDVISEAEIHGIEELVPTYRSLLVRYNPAETDYEQLMLSIKNLEKRVERSTAEIEGRKVIVPVVYGSKYGPDLGYIAKHYGLTEERVVKLHSERVYRVYMIGFVAGFPYLGEVAEEIAIPRLETPRLKVPAGSVGIAEKQTGIYSCEAPGGWRIVGRTPLKLFDPLQQPPALLASGDTVRFKPISESEFRALTE
jgi:KipI family sensor histidine kinase inhibitor